MLRVYLSRDMSQSAVFFVHMTTISAFGGTYIVLLSQCRS